MYLNVTNKLKLRKHLKSNVNLQKGLTSNQLHKHNKIPLEFLKGFFIGHVLAYIKIVLLRTKVLLHLHNDLSNNNHHHHAYAICILFRNGNGLCIF